MKDLEKTINDISSSLGSQENPYFLSDLADDWMPNRPIEVFADIDSVRSTLLRGEEIFLNFEDDTFVVSICLEEDTAEPLIKVEAILDAKEVVHGKIRVDLLDSDIHFARFKASRIHNVLTEKLFDREQ